MQKKWKEWGKCPACGKKGHSFRLKDGRRLASSRLYDCQKWREIQNSEQVKVLQQVKGCKICTSWLHNHSQYDAKRKTCGVDENGVVCNLPHNKIFHGFKHIYINTQIINCNHTLHKTIMLPMQEVVVNGTIKTTVFYDGGSNASMITHELANKLVLSGTPTTSLVRYATKEPELIDTFLYRFTFRLIDGTKHKAILMGVKEITSKPPETDVSSAYDLFPFTGKGEWFA